MDAQGSQPHAKEDTVGLWLDSTVTTDLSQIGSDLTAVVGATYSATGGYRAADTARALDGAGGRELFVRCCCVSEDSTYVLLGCGGVAAPGSAAYVLTQDALTITATQNGVVLGRVFHDVGIVQDLSISWSTRPNPDTTGAADALTSELWVYAHTNNGSGAPGWYSPEVFAHAIATIPADPGFFVGGWGGYAAEPWSLDSPQIISARVGRAWHPSTEVGEDWVAARTPHVSSLAAPAEPLGAIGTLEGGASVGGVGDWAGQANAGLVGTHARELRGRMLSPLVAEVYQSARTLTSTPTPAAWLRPAPGSLAYSLDVTTLRWLPVPGVQRAYVRVHVQSWVITGAAVAVGVRCYAMNRAHVGLGSTIGGSPTPALEYATATATITVDNGPAGLGQWLDLGLIDLPIFSEPIEGWTGTITLGLAHAFDTAAANIANARLKIKAWHVQPVIGVP